MTLNGLGMQALGDRLNVQRAQLMPQVDNQAMVRFCLQVLPTSAFGDEAQRLGPNGPLHRVVTAVHRLVHSGTIASDDVSGGPFMQYAQRHPPSLEGDAWLSPLEGKRVERPSPDLVMVGRALSWLVARGGFNSLQHGDSALLVGDVQSVAWQVLDLVLCSVMGSGTSDDQGTSLGGGAPCRVGIEHAALIRAVAAMMCHQPAMYVNTLCRMCACVLSGCHHACRTAASHIVSYGSAWAACFMPQVLGPRSRVAAWAACRAVRPDSGAGFGGRGER